jgi:hypothetical protein
METVSSTWCSAPSTAAWRNSRRFSVCGSGTALTGRTTRNRCGASWEGRLFSKRDHEFESAFLQRRVDCELTSPAPDSDSEPKCRRCQSFVAPFSALYWHIGDTAIRLARVMPPRLSDSNRDRVFSSDRPDHHRASACGFESRWSIADDRAALVTYPISETQIVDPHVVKSGAHRRRGT